MDLILKIFELGTLPFAMLFDSIKLIGKFMLMLPTPMWILILLVLGIFLVRLIPL